jgi:hypothetical protein
MSLQRNAHHEDCVSEGNLHLQPGGCRPGICPTDELHWKAEVFGSEFLSPVLSQISQYLGFNIKNGKLRALDPTILTVTLLMTALMHPQIAG